MGVRQERARAEVNTAFGAKTEYVTPEEIKALCPQIDLDGGGVYRVDRAPVGRNRVAFDEAALERHLSSEDIEGAADADEEENG